MTIPGSGDVIEATLVSFSGYGESAKTPCKFNERLKIAFDVEYNEDVEKLGTPVRQYVQVEVAPGYWVKKHAKVREGD